MAHTAFSTRHQRSDPKTLAYPGRDFSLEVLERLKASSRRMVGAFVLRASAETPQITESRWKSLTLSITLGDGVPFFMKLMAYFPISRA